MSVSELWIDTLHREIFFTIQFLLYFTAVEESNGLLCIFNGAKQQKLVIYRYFHAHWLILSLFLKKPQRTFSFSFPEEMDSLIGFIFLHGLFLGIRPLENTKKSDIKILV